jgi:hypothetical protein
MPRFYETTLSITNLHNLSISTHVNRSRIFINGSGNVQFAAGAVLANHNNPNSIKRRGLTLGNTINGTNMDISQEIVTYEYGHTLQGRRWGPLYFLMIAPGSLISCWNDTAQKTNKHSYRWYERQANKLGYEKYRREPLWPNSNYPFNKY